MKKFIIAALALGPVAAFAQATSAGQPNLGFLTSFLSTLKSLINTALPLVVGLALLAFFWGVAQFIWGGEAKRDEGKQHMIWGIVGLFVMVSVWGLVQFLGSVVGVTGTGGTAQVPTVTGL
ncbi:MAG: protein of unknown function with transrane region [Parcubacteria group bacterium]|nr:protein of unknown function with transrane region [Parcubacteria group bacterium]